MSKEYWADAWTTNCVWLFQVSQMSWGSEGCTCGEEDSADCTCGVNVWHTHAVFLTKDEARCNSGVEGKDWRIYGVPCYGLMAELLGRHAAEFEDEVEYIIVSSE